MQITCLAITYIEFWVLRRMSIFLQLAGYLYFKRFHYFVSIIFATFLRFSFLNDGDASAMNIYYKLHLSNKKLLNNNGGRSLR
jgi:hypothetical protein